jgi:hypothetical protein
MQVINATTGRAIAKLAETLGLTVKMRGESTEVLLATDLRHRRVNWAFAAQTLAGECIAARYRTDRNQWQSRRGSAGSLEELIARGVKTYTSALACLRAQLPSQR